VGNSHGQRVLRGIWTKKLEIQAIKMATYTLIEDYFLTIPRKIQRTHINQQQKKRKLKTRHKRDRVESLLSVHARPFFDVQHLKKNRLYKIS
jgi:hypothetical protein